jgi:hypothetical protein
VPHILPERDTFARGAPRKTEPGAPTNGLFPKSSPNLSIGGLDNGDCLFIHLMMHSGPPSRVARLPTLMLATSSPR